MIFPTCWGRSLPSFGKATENGVQINQRRNQHSCAASSLRLQRRLALLQRWFGPSGECQRTAIVSKLKSRKPAIAEKDLKIFATARVPLFEVGPANCYRGDQNMLINLAVDQVVA